MQGCKAYCDCSLYTMKKTFYITTPIYYVTAKPHLGTLYSTLLADVLARWHTLLGVDTFFLTGTDEHGQKIAQAAAASGQEPQQFVDSFIPDFLHLWQLYSINYSRFIRTTDFAHKAAVQRWLQQLLATGDIYKGSYRGWYCTPCETFLTETDVAGQQAPACPTCRRATSIIAEEAYFFKLSNYQDALLQWYSTHPTWMMPSARLHEIVAFVQRGLKDLCISRSTISWGIPFPDDTAHVTYVWADALNNYLTAIGYLQEGRAAEVARWWPADIQVMGKDIARFHAVYWPAFLMASGLALPHQLLVHGWITVDGNKMSKSLGNVVDPILLQEQYGTDAVRYYLVAGLPIAHDANFSQTEMQQKINTDLAGELGNLLNRLLALAARYDLQELSASPTVDSAASALQQAGQQAVEQYAAAMAAGQLHMACAAVKTLVGHCNAFFHAQEPWKQVAMNRQEFTATLHATAATLATIATLFWPIMPTKMMQLLQALSLSLPQGEQLAQQLLAIWQQPIRLQPCSPLFAKIEIPMEQPITSQAATPATVQYDEIDITAFAQSHLVVGTITAVVPVAKSDKLLQLTVDCGAYGMRQILSGVAKHFGPDDLVGKQALFVLNLKPRTMMGLISHGMLLTAAAACC
ncbi:methionine--tRNA ligase, partial [Candidatus Dependentiae bacterium]|nr:methionine--tRNA ligase [Candidatus Dependentiae bacterium]